MKVELEDLTGEHILSGVDFVTLCNGENAGTNAIQFCIDGIVYEATEDPEDDWRSSMGYFGVVDRIACQNSFQGVKVAGIMNYDVLSFVDIITGKLVLEVGTDCSDSFYPCCIMYFNPENMSVNENNA